MAEIGSTLREARMRARIDISEVEAQTKIRAKYLRALENEEWDLLPGSVYVKSFLKTYGSYLGLDSRLLIDEFKRRYERPMDHDPRPQPSAGSSGRERESRERSSRGRVQRRRSRGRGRNVRPRINAGVLVSPPVLIIVLLLVIGGAFAVIGGLTSGGNPPSNPSGSGSHPGSSPSGTDGLSTTTTTTTKHHHHRRPATLAIVPTGTIYVCVKRPSGKQVLVGTYAAGQTVPKMSGKALLVTLGNADATVKANGKPYALTPSSTPIGLRVKHSGVTPLSSGPTCS